MSEGEADIADKLANYSQPKPKNPKEPAKAKKRVYVDGDNTELAKELNKVIRTLLIVQGTCPKEITQDEIDDINMGGALASTLFYFVPLLDPKHPLLKLSVRLLRFASWFYVRCICRISKKDKADSSVGVAD